MVTRNDSALHTFMRRFRNLTDGSRHNDGLFLIRKVSAIAHAVANLPAGAIVLWLDTDVTVHAGPGTGAGWSGPGEDGFLLALRLLSEFVGPLSAPASSVSSLLRQQLSLPFLSLFLWPR